MKNSDGQGRARADNASARANHNLLTLILCFVCVLLNVLLSRLTAVLGLPLYLDTIGTVLSAAAGGYLPGILVGLATNMLKGAFDVSSYYYSVINVLIAVCSAWFARFRDLRKPKDILGLIGMLTLIGGGLGSLLPLLINDVEFVSGDLAAVLYGSGGIDRNVSYVLANLILDLADKSVSVAAALLIMRLIPEEYLSLFTLTMWQQAPFTREETRAEDARHFRIHALRNRILMALSVLLLLLSVIIILLSSGIFRRTILREHAKVAEEAAEVAAGVIDGDQVPLYLKAGEEMPEYRSLKKIMQAILDSSSEIKYLYVYQPGPDGCRVVLDLDAPETPAEEIGTLIPFDEGLRDQLSAFLSGGRIESFVTRDSFGYLMTAYKPVFDSAGKCVCYVGVDVEMEQMDLLERGFIIELVSMFMGFFILFSAFLIWLAQYDIVYPVNAMTRWLDGFRSGHSQQQMDDDVQKLRAVDIRTGDELEELYKAFTEMTMHQAEQMRSILRLSESTELMQDGLITTMADMVEKRDADTGAHIQKTSAYVKIIAEGLRAKGYYAEKVTPKFISDVVRSAPLHDVGKINISDTILNKPGKLTEEEFNIMKTHTTAGKNIMEKAIAKVDGESYLKEARNMAACHHERWDGKGYPEGLHGEEIPLSARIMAVADVFDALTSKRVYKPAFPPEKALAIIEEGKGTQFDPKCVEVFMDFLPDIMAVLDKYRDDEPQDSPG